MAITGIILRRDTKDNLISTTHSSVMDDFYNPI
jgi:hypothetical protein